jgi:hypothetical protein
LRRGGKRRNGKYGEKKLKCEQMSAHDFAHSVAEARLLCAELCFARSATQIAAQLKRPICKLQTWPFRLRL